VFDDVDHNPGIESTIVLLGKSKWSSLPIGQLLDLAG
jgi:hypothetical protein